MSLKINNPDNIPESVVFEAVKMMERESGRTVQELSIRRTGGQDEYGITPVFEPVPFQRIRRITGYLVGDLDRFNNAKRAEVDDRVKHCTIC